MTKKIIFATSFFFLLIITSVIAPVFAFSSLGSDHVDRIENDKDYIQSAYGFMNPLENIIITNDWGEWSAIEDYDNHPAVDLSCSTGEPLVSATDGVITQAGYGWDIYGAMTLWIRTSKNPNIRILYAHMSKVYVEAGDHIKKGQVIAACGSTGVSTDSHLHLQVEEKGKIVNPHFFFKLK